MAGQRALWKIVAAIAVVGFVIGVALLLGVEAGHYYASKRKLAKRDKSTQAILKQMNTLGIGDTVPDFALEDLGYNRVWLNDLLSHKTLISFFYPDCDACMLDFERLKAAASDSADYRYFIFISSSDPEELVALKEEYGLSAFILYDHDQEFSGSIGVFTFPLNVIVNQSGKIENIIGGPLEEGEFVDLIQINKAAEAGRL